MKSLARFTWFLLLSGFFIISARAAFTSIYIFGDGASTTTTNAVAAYEPYYGLRNSNGRVWVELLAQELNLTNNFWYSNDVANHLSYTNLSAASTNWSYSSNNWSYFGDTAGSLVTNVNAFTAPPDASNALFVVWVNDADFVLFLENSAYGPPYSSNNMAPWTNTINLSISNHFRAITNLYAKGVRTLVMPNAVDLTEVPEFNQLGPASKSFVRQRMIDFNIAFTATLSNAMAACPGLKIYEPDFFSLLDNILANPAAYGVTNALYNGYSVDVIEAYQSGYGLLANDNIDGPGTNYIFWDAIDPTAKVHAIMADVAKQLIAPAQISRITSRNGTNQLNLTNVPVGLNGVVIGGTNLALTNWVTVTNFNSIATVQSVFLPASGPLQFYRVTFPYAWSWP